MGLCPEVTRHIPAGSHNVRMTGTLEENATLLVLEGRYSCLGVHVSWTDFETSATLSVFGIAGRNSCTRYLGKESSTEMSMQKSCSCSEHIRKEELSNDTCWSWRVACMEKGRQNYIWSLGGS